MLKFTPLPNAQRSTLFPSISTATPFLLNAEGILFSIADKALSKREGAIWSMGHISLNDVTIPVLLTPHNNNTNILELSSFTHPVSHHTFMLPRAIIGLLLTLLTVEYFLPAYGNLLSDADYDRLCCIIENIKGMLYDTTMIDSSTAFNLLD